MIDTVPLDFERIRRALQRGTIVADRVFDEVFPLAARAPSNVYWTPVEVAVRASRLLADKPGRSILDIGAGVGKFCIVAASVVDASVRGIEHRPHLVDVARRAADKIGVAPEFDGARIDEIDPLSIDGVYLYNPFAENLCARADQLDATVELSEARFLADIRATSRLLSKMKPGSRVVTYCGWGGAMPESFDLVTRERCAGMIEVWQKRDRPRRARAARGPRLGAASMAALKERAVAAGETMVAAEE